MKLGSIRSESSRRVWRNIIGDVFTGPKIDIVLFQIARGGPSTSGEWDVESLEIGRDGGGVVKNHNAIVNGCASGRVRIGVSVASEDALRFDYSHAFASIADTNGGIGA